MADRCRFFIGVLRFPQCPLLSSALYQVEHVGEGFLAFLFSSVSADQLCLVFGIQDPVVQSIVSLTSSLRGQLIKCFTTLFPNTLIFFVENISHLYFLTLFSKKEKNWHISDTNIRNFNEMLTNDVICFEQLGPELRLLLLFQ